MEALSEPAHEPAREPAGKSPPAHAARNPDRAWRIVMMVLLAALAAIVAWQWLDSRNQIAGLREELAIRLRDAGSDSRDARLGARAAQEAVREAQVKLSQLEAKLLESQNQQVALEALYQELSRSRDESILAEIDQILTIASQQLQLAGNVQAALVALQTADSRLARSDRPQFIPLRKVLARDIERLKNTPNVDLAGLVLKLDQVIAGVDALPLANDARPPASRADKGESNNVDGFWTRLSGEVLGELRQLVRIQNVDRQEPALLAPPQIFFLRENLKLRLLNARLALLQRDESVFREDLKTATAWLARYFDPRARQSATAMATLKQLSSSGISLGLPAINDSIAAARNYKVSRDRAAR